MKTIHKLELDSTIDANTIVRTLAVGIQHNRTCVWVERSLDPLPPELKPRPGLFRLFTTGWVVPSSAVYVGTTQEATSALPGGYFVGHVYWVPEG